MSLFINWVLACQAFLNHWHNDEKDNSCFLGYSERAQQAYDSRPLCEDGTLCTLTGTALLLATLHSSPWVLFGFLNFSLPFLEPHFPRDNGQG